VSRLGRLSCDDRPVAGVALAASWEHKKVDRDGDYGEQTGQHDEARPPVEVVGEDRGERLEA
jgi:hypothetical protein